VNEKIKIKERDPKDLIPAEYNPRQLSEKQFKDIEASLKRFGCVDPIIVNIHKDRKNIIVGGHQRLKVMMSLGYEKVPTVEVNLNRDQEKELNIRLNKNFLVVSLMDSHHHQHLPHVNIQYR
jgi:ParB-like chromosome segregation protein Spo0J